MLRGSVTEELVFGFDVGLGEGIGGRERVRAKIRPWVKIWVRYKSRHRLASGYRDSFGCDGMRWRVDLRKVGLERGCRRFIKVIRYQRRCVVLWRESAACERWKSRISQSVQSALRLARRAESGEQSHPGSPAAAGLWLGR